jgi:hypothetical protein
MPGPVLHSGTVATCPHGGALSIIAASPRVMVSGMPAAVLTDQGMVAGCVFTLPNGTPQPCVTTRWMVGATRVLANGQPLLINPCVALCMSAPQIPGGPPIIASSQMRVVAM